MSRITDVTIKTKLYGLVTISVFSLLAVLGLAMYELANFRVTGPMYERLMLRKTAMAELEPCTLFVVEPYLTLNQALAADDPAATKRLIGEFRQQEDHFRDRQAYWQEKLYDGPVKQAITTKVVPTANEFFRTVKDDFLPVLEKGDRVASELAFESLVQPVYQKHADEVDKAVQIGQDMTDKEEAETAQRVSFWLWVMIFVSVVSVLFVAVTGVVLARSIVHSTGKLIRRINEMASGSSDLTARVAVNSQDEIGQLACGINGMIGKIHAVVSKVRESSVQLLSTAAEMSATARQQESTVQDDGNCCGRA
jgi:methyl-accepting chemotaxis protein WspA